MVSNKMSCPRDGSTLVAPDSALKSVFARNGISHCPTCAGLALNSNVASSEICSNKLEMMHDSFKDEGTPVGISCPFCQTGMKVRDFAFRKIDGSLTELIEIDGCPNCSSFWLDAGELQRLSPPGGNNMEAPPSSEAGTLAIVFDLLFHLPLVFI
jgi:Zn-finger nucleic acid-binding protein